MARKITECSELNGLLLELRDENVDRNADRKVWLVKFQRKSESLKDSTAVPVTF